MRPHGRVVGRAAAGAAFVLVIVTFLSPLGVRAASPRADRAVRARHGLGGPLERGQIPVRLRRDVRRDPLGAAVVRARSGRACSPTVRAPLAARSTPSRLSTAHRRWRQQHGPELPLAVLDVRGSDHAAARRAAVRTYLQRYGSSWTTCRDTGFSYNTTTAWAWVGGIDMGAAPDCGAGTYRTWGTGQVYQGGAWRGASVRDSPAVDRLVGAGVLCRRTRRSRPAAIALTSGTWSRIAARSMGPNTCG